MDLEFQRVTISHERESNKKKKSCVVKQYEAERTAITTTTTLSSLKKIMFANLRPIDGSINKNIFPIFPHAAAR